MEFFFAIIIGSSFVMTAFHYWKRLCGDELVGEERRRFVRWVITGAAIPFLVWVILNSGAASGPLWPYVAPMSAGLNVWWNSFRTPASVAFIFIASYWSGVTALWLLVGVWERTEDRQKFRSVCRTWAIVAVPLFIIPVAIAGWEAVGMALTFGGVLLLHMTLGIMNEKAPTPSYARALAKISFGKYEEAEMEVIRELEQWAEDFDGWMMLADLYATHFSDLAAAEETIRDLCAQPSTTSSQASVALHRLADWHLKLGHDPVAARKILEQICLRMPGTHLARMARQRIARLPATREDLLEQERGKPLPLPEIPDEEPAASVSLSAEQATLAANQCVELLKRNPDDIAARERFARLLAENLGAAGTGIEQLELLLAMPEQNEARRAKWLLLMAQWHSRYQNDTETARLVYHQVMRDFPTSAQAFAAQRRLNLLNLQAQVRRRSAAAL